MKYKIRYEVILREHEENRYYETVLRVFKNPEKAISYQKNRDNEISDLESETYIRISYELVPSTKELLKEIASAFIVTETGELEYAANDSLNEITPEGFVENFKKYIPTENICS